jgi:hypothetical protein
MRLFKLTWSLKWNKLCTFWYIKQDQCENSLSRSVTVKRMSKLFNKKISFWLETVNSNIFLDSNIEMFVAIFEMELQFSQDKKRSVKYCFVSKDNFMRDWIIKFFFVMLINIFVCDINNYWLYYINNFLVSERKSDSENVILHVNIFLH